MSIGRARPTVRANRQGRLASISDRPMGPTMNSAPTHPRNDTRSGRDPEGCGLFHARQRHHCTTRIGDGLRPAEFTRSRGGCYGFDRVEVFEATITSVRAGQPFEGVRDMGRRRSIQNDTRPVVIGVPRQHAMLAQDSNRRFDMTTSV